MKVLTNNQYYSQIANVIREQNGTNNTYKPAQMVSALKDLFYEEVERVPPITFQEIGENLLDYRIFGASGGVGDRTKNLLQNTATSRTINGVTFTFNNDGSVTCNGTPKSGIYSDLLLSGTPYGEKIIVEYGNYIFSSIGSSSALAAIIGNGTHEIGRARGNDVTFTDDVSWVLLRCYGVEEPQTVYPMIRLASIEDDTYEPYGYKVPVVVSSKNFLQNTATTQVKNGVTFTINEDKSISCNGTASGNAFFKIGDIQLEENCIMSGCPAGGNNNSYLMRLYNNGSVFKTDSGTGVLINSEVQNGYAEIRIAAGYTCNNLTFYPMIRPASIEDTSYEPYVETTTNIYLDEPIEENESISLSDTNVNIPTIRGTNVLTVNTTVQPSNVYVKARKESQYETIMREDYEEQLSDIESALQEV